MVIPNYLLSNFGHLKVTKSLGKLGEKEIGIGNSIAQYDVYVMVMVWKRRSGPEIKIAFPMAYFTLYVLCTSIRNPES
jgi:hypothetical protein